MRNDPATAGPADSGSNPRATRRRSARAGGADLELQLAGGAGRARARVDVTRRAFIVATFGSPGTGKSHDQKKLLDKLQPRRLVLVDPDGEYTGWGDLVDRPAELLKRLALPEYRVRFRPDIDRKRGEAQFAWLCSVVRWQVDPQPGQARPASTAPVLLVVDELADLVGPSFREAPASWRWCVRRGRKYGVSVMAASQRPEEIDKSFYAMPSLLVVHAIGEPNAARNLARSLTVKPEEVSALSGHAFIARDRNTGRVIRS